MTSADRSKNLLERKFAALSSVAKPWLDKLSQEPHLKRMTSQTEAVTLTLQSLIAGIERDLKSHTGDPRPLENRIVAAWQFWNGYRAKFDQRRDEGLEQFLRGADELAWLCYKPARTAALKADDPACKEPPLIYLSSQTSPFVDPRATRYQPEGIPERLIQAYGWPKAATLLPFPVIGVPPYQCNVLPAALAIIHEVGHAVESDFGVEPRLKDLIQNTAGLSAANATAWERWSSEMFADYWGCLGAGGSFVQSLSDFLLPAYTANPDDSLTTEYPPPPLRIWWNVKVLESLKCSGGNEVWSEWKTQTQPTATFLIDAKLIATQWTEAQFVQFGGKKLREVLYFSNAQAKDAGVQAANAVGDIATSHNDVRVLWAAIQSAFTEKATVRLLEVIFKKCEDSPRKVEPKSIAAGRNQYLTQMGGALLK